VSSNFTRKPMATVSASPLVDQISGELSALRNDKYIQAVCSQWLDDIYVVWVGLLEDNSMAREAVYRLEDEISEKFPQVLFDFHVIALPRGKKIQDYISNAQLVFQRIA
jgi:hypothetical protein